MLTDWLFWGTGIALGIAGLWLMYRALLIDRPTAERRCPKCKYNMRGTESFRCPECGHVARHERQLHGTQRFWKTGSLALIMLLAGLFIWKIPDLRLTEWHRQLPTRVLVQLAPHIKTQEILLELELRADEARVNLRSPMTLKDIERLASMCVRIGMKDGTPKNRERAIAFLQHTLPDPVVATDALMQCTDSQDQNLSLIATKYIGDVWIREGKGSRESLDHLLACLEGVDRPRREAAVKAFSSMGQNAIPAMPILLRLLREGDEETSDLTAQAIANLGPVAGDLVPDVLAMLDVSDLSTSRLLQVLESITLELPESAPRSIMPFVQLDANRDSNARIRSQAIRLLGMVRPMPEAVEQTLRDALDDSDFDIRVAALNAIGSFPYDSDMSVKALLPFLKDDNSYLAKLALDLLPRFDSSQDDHVVQSVAELVHNRSAHPYSRTRAISVLCQIGTREQVLPVLESLLRNPEPLIPVPDMPSNRVVSMPSQAFNALANFEYPSHDLAIDYALLLQDTTDPRLQRSLREVLKYWYPQLEDTPKIAEAIERLELALSD